MSVSQCFTNGFINFTPIFFTRPRDKHCVGILDMSGFEDLGKNGFNQLLINVANERLQYYFNEYLFSREQREMEEGGIDWSHVHYENNQDILSLFFVSRKLSYFRYQNRKMTHKKKYWTELLGFV